MNRHSGRIALFLPLLVGGGAERVMVNLAQGFVKQGLNVDLVLGKAEGPYLDQVPKEARLVDLRSSRVLGSLPGLVRYLRKDRPMALISALDHANIVALWAKHMAGVQTRVVVSLHNTISEKMKKVSFASKQQFFPFLIRSFFPWADEIVAVSNGVAADYAQFTGIPSNRIKVIYNSVIAPELFEKAQEPLEHRWFNPKEPPVILSVGRLTEQKNYSELIQAFAKVREKHAARLLILGEGELRPKLEALIEELGLGKEVALPGFVANPYNYMANAAVFVLSSKWEGLPTVLIEALAVGTPVISTDCKSGPTEILKGGELGKLVSVGDVAALADAIADSLTNKKTNLKPEALKRFEPNWAVEEYLKVIRGKTHE